jgi:Zn-dependent M28 family amino/carboxypeptidase
LPSKLQRLGFEPAAGNGSWYQPVRLVGRRRFGHRAAWSFEGKPLELGEDNLLLTGGKPMEQVRDAPVMFVGHGAPGQIRGARLDGAVALMLVSGPEGAALPELSERVKSLTAAGAAAVIAIFNDDVPWSSVQGAYAQGTEGRQSDAVGKVQGAMPYAAAARLVDQSGASLDELANAAGQQGFQATPLKLRASLDVSTAVNSYTSHNVIGRLRGSGKSGESVLYLGHWDHLGICRREGARDRICNGAVDNASGIAMLLEIAAHLARGKRPERDILFMATTAEEMGLLGARHFAANSTVPLKSIVAAINVDTVAIHHKGEPVAVIGRGNAALDALIAQTAAELGRTVDNDKEADAFVKRQDGWALTRAGVPAVMVGGSFANMKQLGAFLSGPYHKPEDDLKREIILDGAAEDAELLIALGRKLADPRTYRPARAGAR